MCKTLTRLQNNDGRAYLSWTTCVVAMGPYKQRTRLTFTYTTGGEIEPRYKNTTEQRSRHYIS